MRPSILWIACLTALGPPSAAAQQSSYKKALGTAALTDVQSKVPKVLSRYQYEIEQQNESPSLLTILTRWNPRYPLEDETAQGVTEAMTRLTLTARARARTGGTADVRIVDLTVENRVLTSDSTEWHGLMTPMFKKYVDQLIGELKTELLTGIRVY